MMRMMMILMKMKTRMRIKRIKMVLGVIVGMGYYMKMRMIMKKDVLQGVKGPGRECLVMVQLS